MDFLGIGPLELVFIFIVILLVLGPKDMIKTGGKVGKFVRRILTSDSWRAIRTAQREMRSLPNKLAKEAGIDDFRSNAIHPPAKPKTKPRPKNEIGEVIPELKAWTTSPDDDDEAMPEPDVLDQRDEE